MLGISLARQEICANAGQAICVALLLFLKHQAEKKQGH
jgi:hypothetical protein